MSIERPAQPLVIVVKGRGDVQPVQIPGGPTLLIVTPKDGGFLGGLVIALLVLLAVLVIAGVIAAAVAVPIYSGFVDDAKWSEAESALGAIKTSADTYLSQYGRTALDTFEIRAAPIATSGPQWAQLKFDTDSFKDMAYWDARAFSFSTPGIGHYTIIVNTTNLGLAGNPPTDPGGITVVINDFGATWIRHGSSQ